MVNFWSFGAQNSSNKEMEHVRKKVGVVGGCIYRQRLMEAGIIRATAFVNRSLTEAVTLVQPPPLID
jgi:hypothetical protein